MHAVVFVGKVYTGNRISTRSHEDLRALKPNEIFNDFAISWDLINEIDPDYFHFKGMGCKLTPNSIGPDHTKCSEVGAE